VGLISTRWPSVTCCDPALDGGRLRVRHRWRRISPERERAVHAVGFALLLGLMIYISYLDLVRPVIPR
jgi:regulator of sigma E protease